MHFIFDHTHQIKNDVTLDYSVTIMGNPAGQYLEYQVLLHGLDPFLDIAISTEPKIHRQAAFVRRLGHFDLDERRECEDWRRLTT